MSFQPVLPSGGMTGWAFLQRTQTAQTEAFSNSPAISRKTGYFAENIASVRTAEDLVSDRRLLEVALGAFGLEDDINNQFFIRKVLEDGTLTTDALANKLTDDRYKNLSKAFGFGDFATPRTVLSGFAEEITSEYQRQSFAVAVGEQDQALRLALNMQHSLKDIAGGTSGDTAKWYRVMGNPPLRSVFEGALGLPGSFGRLDLDQQLGVFQDKTARVFGDETISQFTDSAALEKLAQTFLLRQQISDTSGLSSAQAALTLLQSSG